MRDKLQEIIKDAQEDTYSDSPRFVDAILKLLAPMLEKARKWDRATEVINSSHLYALAEWIDLKYPNDSDPEVQTDLRRLADIFAGKEEGDERTS